MFMRTKALSAILAGCLWSGTVWAQGTSRLDPRSTMHINLPEDSPVTVLGADWGESSATARGGAMLLDLHTSLSLRNSSNRRIRGVTLLVMAQEVTPGGKASVSVASLNVGPGENFPIRIDLRLLRPLQSGSGPLVEVGLDGVLFDDLSFYGPNRLNSRRSMTVWELEAKRDRRYFRNVLDREGADGLRREMLESVDRQARRNQMDARVQPGKAGFTTAGRQVELAFLNAGASPLSANNGVARVIEDEARTPTLFVQNQSNRAMRGVEMGWLIKDQSGREYVTGAMPLDLQLGPKQKTKLVQDASFKFSQSGGQPIRIDSISAFLNSVEFEDGSMWVPERWSKLPTPSPEEQRLVELYKKRGLQTLVEELKKF